MNNERFKVLWEIEVGQDDNGNEFKSPLDIAKWARKVQQDPGNRATNYLVMDQETEEIFSVNTETEIVSPLE